MTRLHLTVFISGAVLMALEIVGSRVLAPVFGSSIFVWGGLISTFLASLAVGYAWGGRLADRRPDPRLLANIISVAALLIWGFFLLPKPVLEFFARVPVPERFQSLLAAIALFSAPSVLMGVVTPFAVRLAAKNLASVGSSAGNLSAVSTAGSILGTFLAAFFLIPSFSTRTILFFLGVTLLVAALLLPGALTRPRAAGSLALTALAAAAYQGPSVGTDPRFEGQILLEKETAYHRLRVVERGRRRSLYFDRLAQGWLDLRPGQEGLLPSFSHGLLAAHALIGGPWRSTVVIGLGAGVVPTALTRRAPEIAVTSIEIDPEVVRAASTFFAFQPDANDRVLVGDGRRELDLRVSEVDAILEDAFFADSVPFHLTTREFYALCLRKLSPHGVLAANFIGAQSGAENRLFWSALKSMADVFPRVYVFSPELANGSTTFQGNAIVVATRSRDRLDRGMIADRIHALAERLGIAGMNEWAAALYDGEMRWGSVPILRDEFAPTDALQHLGR